MAAWTACRSSKGHAAPCLVKLHPSETCTFLSQQLSDTYGVREQAHPRAASRVAAFMKGAGRKPLARGPCTSPLPLDPSSADLTQWMRSTWASMSWMPSSLTVKCQ